MVIDNGDPGDRMGPVGLFVRLVAFEAGLGVVALVIGAASGLDVLATFAWSLPAFLFGVAAAFWIVLPLLAPFGPGALAWIALAAGFGEELFFRGLLQAWLAEGLGLWPGLVLASLLFGLAHPMTFGYFVIATLLGGVLGLVWIWSGNLLAAIVAHALYDWIVILDYRRRYPTSSRGISSF